MKNKKIQVLLLIVLLMTSVILPNNISEAQSQGKISVNSVSGFVGDKVTVNIRIDNFSGFGVQGISGGNIQIHYDKSILKINRITEGNLIAGNDYFKSSSDNASGLSYVFASGNQSISSNGVVFSVTFELLKSGTTSLQLKNVDLKDQVPNTIPSNRIAIQNGSVESKLYIATTGISLNKTNLNLNVGQAERLVATVSPSNATNKGVEWTSSNRNIATVDSNGNVRGVGPGTATITAKTTSGNKVTTANVTVVAPVLGVSIQGNPKILINTSEDLTVIFNPQNASNKKVSWTSSNTSVATIDNNGKVTGVGEGTTIITVTSEDGNKKATFNLEVVTSMPLSGVKFVDKEISIYQGQRQRLEIQFNPSNATNKKLKWESSNSNIVTIDSEGIIRGLVEGEALITAISEDGNHKATISVKVNKRIGEDIKTELNISNNSSFKFPFYVLFGETDVKLSDDRINVVISRELLESTFEHNNIYDFEEFEINVNKVHAEIPEQFRVLSSIYDFTLKVDGMVVSNFSGNIEKIFSFDPTLVDSLNNVSLYWFNDTTGNWEIVDSIVDVENRIVMANINHWSKFVLLEDLSVGKSFFSGTVGYGALGFTMILCLTIGFFSGFITKYLIGKKNKKNKGA